MCKVCTHSYLGFYNTVDSGGYVNEQSLHSNCSVAVCFPEKSSWRWNGNVCQEVMCKAL